MTLKRIPLALVLVSCISTQVTHLAGYDPKRAPTCAAVVKVYVSAAGVGGPFIELAYLNTESSDAASDEAVMADMRAKAAELGANGILLQSIERRTGGVGLVSGVFTPKPEGKGIAIWVPSDTVNLRETCARAPDPRTARQRQQDCVTGRSTKCN